MKKINFEVDIHAPKQKVWDTLTQPESYKEWTGAAWPGSFYEGSWSQGETIDFISENGSGTRAKIEEVVDGSAIHAKHIGILLPGRIADTDSDQAKNWVGITESYLFKEDGDTTNLTVAINAPEEWAPMFNDGFPKALSKLKELCEQ